MKAKSNVKAGPNANDLVWRASKGKYSKKDMIAWDKLWAGSEPRKAARKDVSATATSRKAKDPSLKVKALELFKAGKDVKAVAAELSISYANAHYYFRLSKKA